MFRANDATTCYGCACYSLSHLVVVFLSLTCLGNIAANLYYLRGGRDCMPAPKLERAVFIQWMACTGHCSKPKPRNNLDSLHTTLDKGNVYRTYNYAVMKHGISCFLFVNHSVIPRTRSRCNVGFHSRDFLLNLDVVESLKT